MVEPKDPLAPLDLHRLSSEVGLPLRKQGGKFDAGVKFDISVQHMTPETRDAHKAMVDSAYAVPAREMTKRAWLLTARHYGTLAVIALLGLQMIAKLTSPLAVAGLLLVAVIVGGVLYGIWLFKGKARGE